MWYKLIILRILKYNEIKFQEFGINMFTSEIKNILDLLITIYKSIT